MNQNCVLIGGKVLHQKVSRLQQGIPKTSGTKLFTVAQGWLHRLENRFELKNIKSTREAEPAMKQMLLVPGRAEEVG